MTDFLRLALGLSTNWLNLDLRVFLPGFGHQTSSWQDPPPPENRGLPKKKTNLKGDRGGLGKPPEKFFYRAMNLNLNKPFSTKNIEI